MPIWNAIRGFGGIGALLWAIAACTSAAQRSASMTLANSTKRPSPVVLTIRPFGAAECAFLVGLDQARIAGDIGREDRREPTFDATTPGGLHGVSSLADDPTPMSAQRALSNLAEGTFGMRIS